MVSRAGMKGPLMGLLLAVAYSAMVIDIIGIVKVREGEDVRSAATIAKLVGSILQLLWCVGYFIRGARGVLYTASSTAGAIGLFFVWQLVTTAIVTAFHLQHRSGYCTITSTNRSDCDGVFRGVEGLGFSLVGLNLIYLAFLASLVSSARSAWSDEMYNIPPIRAPNADLEKAPAH